MALGSRVIAGWLFGACLGAWACAEVPKKPPMSNEPASVASASVPAPRVEKVVAPAVPLLDARDADPLPEAMEVGQAFAEADAALGVTALGSRALDDRGMLTAVARERLVAKPIDEAKILAWLQGMAPACRVAVGAQPETACRGAMRAPDAVAREVYRRVIAAAGESGSLRTGRVLARVLAGGDADVSEAMATLLRRRAALRKSATKCEPPSAERVAKEEKLLDDFVVLEATPKGLRGRAPNGAERADLAYFFASIDASHVKEPTVRRDVAAPSLAADRAAQLAALATGDLERARTIARASFAAWGLDRPVGEGADAAMVMSSAIASFAFDAGVVFDLLGDHAEASRAYRASLGARAKSVDRPLFVLDRNEAILRVDEASGVCTEAVWPRLRRGMLRPVPEMGTRRLQDGGFDVVRLYRGGMLTAHREALVDPGKLRGLTAEQRTKIAARSNIYGSEAFDQRGRLFEGWAEALGAAALDPLLAIARDPTRGPEDRTRALAVLGALLREPDVDPCREPAPSQFLHMYERSVGSLDAVCATRLSDERSKQLAAALGELASDRDRDVRWSAVVALDAFDRDRASPALKRFLRDPFTVPQAPPEERRPIAVLAERALFQRAQKPAAAAPPSAGNGASTAPLAPP